MLLRELSPAAVRAFVAAVGPDSDSVLLSAEIRHLGGALDPEVAHGTATDRDVPQPGVVAGFDAQYLAYGVAVAIPGMEEAIAVSLGRLLSRIEPWRAELDHLNFAEHERPAERMFGDRVHRLRALKNAVDPTGVIRSNHPVRR
jgi:hypothetical protein